MSLTPDETAAQSAGFAMPEGTQMISNGDDSIRQNAVLTHQRITDLGARSFNRGVLPAGANMDDYVTEAHAGMWHIRSQAAAANVIGLPDAYKVQGEFLVFAGAPATQWYLPYAFYGLAPIKRGVNDATTNELSEWEPLFGTAAGGAWVQNHVRKVQFMQEMGGPIDTAGKAAVALRFDHGLLPFRDKVLPLTTARGLKVSQAYNPRNWHYDENAGVTATELNSWVAAGDVEIWNHSANHLDASDEAALEDTIVGGLVEIEAELPAARGKVWGFNPPGVDQETGYGGFGNGNSPEKWDTPAGRLILQHHAVASAYLPGTSIRPLDGTVRDGQSHITMDSISVAAIKGYIDQAIAQRGGLQLMLHPSQLDTAGKLTTAQFTEVLDYIVTKRTAGELVTLSPYEMAVADSTRPTPSVADVDGLAARLAAIEYDSGPRKITSLIDTDAWTTGTTRADLIRTGYTVNLSFRNVRRTDGATGTLTLLTLPTGFRPVGYQFTGTFRGAGFIADRDGAVQISNPTSPSDHMSLTWVTADAPPSTLPGTPA